MWVQNSCFLCSSDTVNTLHAKLCGSWDGTCEQKFSLFAGLWNKVNSFQVSFPDTLYVGEVQYIVKRSQDNFFCVKSVTRSKCKSMLMIIPEQDCSEDHTAEVHLPAWIGAPPVRRSEQHPQTRPLPVQQGGRSCFQNKSRIEPNTDQGNPAYSTCRRCCHMTAGRAACLWPAGGWRRCRRSRQSPDLFCRSKSMQSTSVSLMRSSGKNTDAGTQEARRERDHMTAVWRS